MVAHYNRTRSAFYIVEPDKSSCSGERIKLKVHAHVHQMMITSAQCFILVYIVTYFDALQAIVTQLPL